jgi:hypothetical protein
MGVHAPKKLHNIKPSYTEEDLIFVEHQTLLNLVAYNAETLKHIKKYGRFPPEVTTKRARAHLSRKLQLNGLIARTRPPRVFSLTEKCHELLAQEDQI